MKNKIHFIGIGGVSMSGLALMMREKGYEVSGSDANDSDTLTMLKNAGINVFIGHDAENIRDASTAVYTAAIREDNPELLEARQKCESVLSRAEFIGKLMGESKFPIAVSGTHGKTSTTAMVTDIIMRAGYDPTVAIGVDYKKIGGSVRIGGDGFFIAEACEYRDSFLQFHPRIGVILNIEEDHLDYFRDLNHIIESFKRFAENILSCGTLVINSKCAGLEKIVSSFKCGVVTFGDGADWRAEDLSEGGFPQFSLFYKNESLGRVSLRVPGLYNVQNALAAAAACYAAGINAADICAALNDFSGAGRRFEFKGIFNGARVYDDYAHHPTEIKNTLAAVKKLGFSKIIVAFQPHNYSRTASHFNDFASAFNDADEILLFEIYSVREENESGVSSQKLVDEIIKRGKKARYYENFERAYDYLSGCSLNGGVVLTMGAGVAYKLADLLVVNK